MSYKVINYFEDLQDFNHPYKVGDMFPRLGMKVSEARLKELSSSNNRRKKPLIELVKDVADVQVEENKEVEIVQKQPPKYTKTEINRMPVDELRKLAMSTGVEGADKWTGAELKEYLIALMGL